MAEKGHRAKLVSGLLFVWRKSLEFFLVGAQCSVWSLECQRGSIPMVWILFLGFPWLVTNSVVSGNYGNQGSTSLCDTQGWQEAKEPWKDQDMKLYSIAHNSDEFTAACLKQKEVYMRFQESCLKKKTAFRILQHSCSPLLYLLSAVNETVCTCPKCCLELVFRTTVYSAGINTRGEKKTRVSRATSMLLHLCCGYSALLTQLKHRRTHATELPSFPLNPPIHVVKHPELSFVQA